MALHVTIGSWAIPAIVTAGAFALALGSTRDASVGRGDYDFGGALTGLFACAGAMIASLVAWLVWALFR